MSYHITPQPFIVGALLERVETHNADVAAWNADKAKLRANRKRILDADPFSIDPATLSATREKLTADYLSLLQREAAIAEATLALLEELAPICHEAEQKALADAEAVLSQVLAKMAKAGITLESQQAWPHNPGAARHQLEHQGKQSSDYRAAYVAAQEVKEACSNLVKQKMSLKSALDAIRNDAKRLIEKAVAGDSAGLQLA
ncbi:hypothetical protein [Blastopirellula marina]|uniref:Uncharacterized protein n=1 Tax=Blastopirellula marina TaxID=124 RepID=A0A2S8GQK6_9BACT|nr:hypothetical protein [Blastopirellula marina]PQO46719.1 hypothetical protein C5Y93_07750 [Blastopirellula marina]